MSSVEKKPEHHHIHGGRVSIEQAKIEIRRWKEQFLQLDEDAPYDFVQSFFIPMDDIKHLYENYQQYHPTGVRAYIGITDENENGCAPLRLLLVPATERTDFYNCYCGPEANEPGVDPGDSSVYDFTMPCPDVCADPNEINS